jgi:hypothetical protein
MQRCKSPVWAVGLNCNPFMWASPPQIYAKLAARVERIITCLVRAYRRSRCCSRAASRSAAERRCGRSSGLGQQQDHGPALLITHRVGLGIQPALGASGAARTPLFSQACGRPICFEIGCVNHNPLATGPLIRQSSRNPLGHDVDSSGRSGCTGSCAPYSLGTSTRRPSRPASVCGHRDFGRAAQWRGRDAQAA